MSINFQICVLALFGLGILTLPANAQRVKVTTKQGVVVGRQLVQPNSVTIFRWWGKPYYEFLGVPYAEAPVGPLRFKPPLPAKPWKGTRLALEPSPECPQLDDGTVVGNEDCLYLNIYTPQLPTDSDSLKAVMVWIHGGGFIGGNSYTYGPDRLITKDVILVTIKYRLGTLGFLSLENDAITGNFGLKDQVQALRWVKENIASFGGDAERVTIFGESAGAASVHYLTLSASAKGLFHQAIIQSGTALSQWAFNPSPKRTALRVAAILGLDSSNDDELYNGLMNASADSLVGAMGKIIAEELSDFSNANIAAISLPCVEASVTEEPFITKSPIEIVQSGNYTKVPLIIGTLDLDGISILTAKKFENEDFNDVNTNSSWVVPLAWNIADKTQKEQAGQLIKDFYLNGRNLTWNNIESIIEIFTELYYQLDTQHVISAQISQSNVPVYTYQLTLNMLQSLKVFAYLKQQRVLNLSGAAHGDDVLLLFNIQDVALLPLLFANAEISDRMTSMWTNFAKFGNPNFDDLEVTWRPVTNISSSYLNIGSRLKIEQGNVNQHRLYFWKSLCEAVSTNYPCEFL